MRTVLRLLTTFTGFYRVGSPLTQVESLAPHKASRQPLTQAIYLCMQGAQVRVLHVGEDEGEADWLFA